MPHVIVKLGPEKSGKFSVVLRKAVDELGNHFGIRTLLDSACFVKHSITYG
jgi:hypothetical protein